MLTSGAAHRVTPLSHSVYRDDTPTNCRRRLQWLLARVARLGPSHRCVSQGQPEECYNDAAHCKGGRHIPLSSVLCLSVPFWLEIRTEDNCAMNTRRLTRDEAMERLVASEREIRALGVQRLALFGSVLRGEAGADSDVDLLVQFSPGAKTFDRFLALFDLLEERLGRRVELVTTEALSPFIGPRILAEAQDVLRAA